MESGNHGNLVKEGIGCLTPFLYSILKKINKIRYFCLRNSHSTATVKPGSGYSGDMLCGKPAE
jgi:hypothetical protein